MIINTLIIIFWLLVIIYILIESYVDDKYYQNYHWGNSYKIVIDCYDEEKEIAVSEKEFHVIKIGDKILCNVYRSANRVVTVELNEHWKDAGDKYDN